MERISVIGRLMLASVVAIAMVGCSAGSQSTATKAEEEHFRNPSKTPPPEAGAITGPPPASGQ